MPFVAAPDDLDRVPWTKGPGSVHDRVLRIAREAFDDGSLDEPPGISSRLGWELDGSLEATDFLLRLEAAFGPFPRRSGVLNLVGGPLTGFEQEFFESLKDQILDARGPFQVTLGHVILFLEGRI